MSWSYGEVNGKPVGYSVPDICNHPECDEPIDRGLSYACGGMPGSGLGCDGFFCPRHLEMVDGPARQLCAACVKDAMKELRDDGCTCDPLNQTGGVHAHGCPLQESERDQLW